MMILKLICPILILTIVWWWNRRKKESKKARVPYFEYWDLDYNIREELKEVIGEEILGKLDHTTRVHRVILENQTIAVALFSWPGSAWRLRENNIIDLFNYSHLHWVWVSEEHRSKGYLYKLIDNVISDTSRVSSGLTIDIKDPELKRLFHSKFEFVDKGDYMKLDYSNWKK